MTNITKANVSKFGRDKEGVLLDDVAIAEKFIGKIHSERHLKRVNKCLAAIQRGIENKAKYLDSLKVG